MKASLSGLGKFPFVVMANKRDECDLHKVCKINALKKSGVEKAWKILENVAKQIQPIMSNHKWRVKLLFEVCPKNLSLLGLNVGGGLQEKIRLRRPNRDWDFFPFDQTLDTTFHELCYNTHGPHNANFYKLWDELRMIIPFKVEDFSCSCLSYD
ncbi:DNA-dependent metalloprotease WSS1-like [Humulus lupulus]|uniref:DNA-dependent metalloprotease WSS1-like n=1 Tax=Humulus lupulus TaxID=3486 RepID=UPI002B4047A6|nr:DNA-dependent metalloprotease WSS1-like [Humulus lupulus]